MAGIGEWIIEIEEEGLEGGIVPEYARVKLTKVEVEVSTKIARLLECAKRTIEGKRRSDSANYHKMGVM
jgi:hypothetical protein